MIHITFTRNERGDITIDPMGINGLIKEYYEGLDAHRVPNLDETNQFCKRHNLLRFTHEETDSSGDHKLILLFT